ncbi:MAG TPA: ribosome biogenesis/translation initiation ATPase RLI [Thermoplasmatales archaeon]|nr:ribosome biogenesis/translation initiation ATPase RLI [Thermoplasmatales archaeon]HEX17666.1 ribosome biogenesis/translation initiation ATPase RLI [Thermoplasmatales archaeon]
MRIAVVIKDRCQPKKCSMECIKYCPRVRTGDETIVIGEDGKPIISEELCVGCGICVNKCPFDAIRIVGLPEELETDLVHQYGKNGFRLFRLPIPKECSCVGIIGPNSIGKTTAIKILSGNLVPNLGDVEREASWDRVLDEFRGTEIYNHLKDLADGRIRSVVKPQYIDGIPKILKGKVKDVIKRLDSSDRFDMVVDELGMKEMLNKEVANLSGGELQVLAISAAMVKDADIYFFDEPSSYLDIHQRLKVARVIMELSKRKKVMVVEHDLAILDFMCDSVHILYGDEGAYGIVTHAKPVRYAINSYISGYLKEENIRFSEPIEFHEHPPKERLDLPLLVTFEKISKRFSGFELIVETGAIRSGEVVGVVGPNAIGKTTFVKILAGIIEPDKGRMDRKVSVSYKPQYLSAESDDLVKDIIYRSAEKLLTSKFHKAEIFDALGIRNLLEKSLSSLSGGELQRLAIALCLSKDADLYLLDEPSAYLDSKQRMRAGKTIRRVMEKLGKSALVVDHDVYFIDMISDALMVFEGEPGRRGIAFGPYSLHEGMNRFLRSVDVTFRRDEDTKRPRINKPNSYMDRKQREMGEYYYSMF